jgi:putative Ca2+/H+ antiporter (TMEM165/GDT1 family)
MDFKILSAVFIAELGDRTPLATTLFASDKETSELTVFFGASLALIRRAELHWYEAHGIGRKELKRKRYLD